MPDLVKPAQIPALESVVLPPETTSDTGLLNLFLVLIAGVAGTVAIAVSMTRWRRG
jgi:hypothetical protein